MCHSTDAARNEASSGRRSLRPAPWPTTRNPLGGRSGWPLGLGPALLALVLCLPLPAQSDTITVTDLSDSCTEVIVGSLRWAIEQANTLPEGPHTIEFAVAGVILLQCDLPEITAPETQILGDTAPGPCDPGDPPKVAIDGQHITTYGLSIPTDNCVLRGLRIAQCGTGILIVGGDANQIGQPGPGACERMQIALNGDGVELSGLDCGYNQIRNCAIFENDGVGVKLANGPDKNTIGGSVDEERNYIHHNGTGVGLYAGDQPVLSNRIVGNYIFGNDYNGVYFWSYQWAVRTNVVDANWVGLMPGLLPNGNGWSGICLHGADCRLNTVGPDNIIAYNDSAGVELGYGAGFDTLVANTIYQNTGSGVWLRGSTDSNLIRDNYIGTNTAGEALGNTPHGIHLTDMANNNIVARNVIADNSDAGICLEGSTTGSDIYHNWIGTDRDATAALGNGRGIFLGAGNNTIGGAIEGRGNVICWNVGWGIDAHTDVACGGNYIVGNRIGTNDRDEPMGNGAGGIWLGKGLINNDIGDLPQVAGAKNIIKYNGGIGLKIGQQGVPAELVPVQNRFLTNQICDNDAEECLLVFGGNDELPSPSVASAYNAVVIESGEQVGVVSGQIGFSYPPDEDTRIQVFYDTDDSCGVFYGQTLMSYPEVDWTVQNEPLPSDAHVYATETTRWPGEPTRQTSCYSAEHAWGWWHDMQDWCDEPSRPCPWLGDEDFGRSASWADYDKDGLPDLFICNAGSANLLLRNTGDYIFEEVAIPESLAAPHADSRAAAWGDFDNDGDLDVYLVNSGSPNGLFRNDGDLGFSDVTPEILAYEGPGRGAAWADYDLDGDLDLFLVNYGGGCKLLTNVDGIVFDDRGEIYEPGWEQWLATAAAWADYDLDGDLDLYIVCDGPNALFRNDGDAHFTNVTSGALGDPGAGRAAVWGDYDLDGDLDLYIVNNDGPNRLLRNMGDGTFVDATSGPEGDPGAGHAASAGDLDLDGDLDLYIANDPGPNVLLLNDGTGHFAVGELPPELASSSRICPAGDFELLEGDIDLFLVRGGAEGQNSLALNLQANGHHWLHVNLKGSISNAFGVGARIEVVTGGRMTQTQEVAAGTGSGGQSSITAMFGLGHSEIADMVRVAWPSGAISEIYDVLPDRVIVLDEPSGEDVETDTQSSISVAGLLPCVPNPLCSRTQVTFALAQAGRASLRVHDITGRLVCTLADGVFAKGLQHAVWNGLDLEGRPAPAGVYYLRFDSNGVQQRSIITLVR